MSAKKNANLVVTKNNVAAPLVAVGEAVKQNCKEREDVVRGLQIALICKENILLIGPPGTGKSMVASQFCSALNGTFFQILLDKQTTKDEVVGSVAVEKLVQGKFEREKKGSVLDADIAFFDEVFKCNSSTLNANLSIMNERIFTERGVAQKLRLQSVVAASNELPEGRELAAFDDRLPLRYDVQPVEDDDNFIAILTRRGQVEVPKIAVEQLAVIQQAVQVMAYDEAGQADGLEMMRNLKRAFSNEGLYISTRKWQKAWDIVCANTLLSGRYEVIAEDLEILEHALWSKPEERKTVKRLIAKITNPIGEEIVKHTDAIRELYDLWNSSKLDAMEAGIKIGDSVKKLEKLGKPTENEKLAKAIAYAKQTRMAVLDGTPAGSKK